MRHFVDAKACTSSCGSMHVVRGLTACLRTAVGSHGQGPSAAHLSACCRHHLACNLPLEPWRAAAALHAPQQCRKCSTAAAAPDSTAPEGNSSSAVSSEATKGPAGDSKAAISEPARSSTADSSSSTAEIPVDQPDRSLRSNGTRRKSHEPVTAASAVASSSSSPIGKAAASSTQRQLHPNLMKLRGRRLQSLPVVQVDAAAVEQGMQQLGHSWNNPSSSSGSSVYRGNGSSSSSSAWESSRSSNGGWYNDVLRQAALNNIQRTLSDPSKQPKVDYWGDPALLQIWRDAVAQLQTAVAELAAVSRNDTGHVLTVFFDFETCTGGHHQELVELAAVTSDGQQFQSLVWPLGKVTDEATKNAHQLYKTDLLGAPQLPVVLLQWVQWLTQQCKAADGGSCRLVLAGHNIDGFDIPILTNWMKVMGLGIPARFMWRSLDTRALTTKYLKAEHDIDKFWKLQLVAGKLGLEWPEGTAAHRAMGDVLVNQEVFRKLVAWDFTRSKHPISSSHSQDQLASMSVDELMALHLGLQQQPVRAAPAAAAKAKAAAAAAATAGGQRQVQQEQQQQGRQPPLPVQSQQLLPTQQVPRGQGQQAPMPVPYGPMGETLWHSHLCLVPSQQQQVQSGQQQQQQVVQQQQFEPEQQQDLVQQQLDQQTLELQQLEQRGQLGQQQKGKGLTAEQQQKRDELLRDIERLTTVIQTSPVRNPKADVKLQKIKTLLAQVADLSAAQQSQQSTGPRAIAAADETADAQHGSSQQQQQQSSTSNSRVGLTVEGVPVGLAAYSSGSSSSTRSVDSSSSSWAGSSTRADSLQGASSCLTNSSSSSTDAEYSPASSASWEDSSGSSSRSSSRGRSSTGAKGRRTSTEAGDTAAYVSSSSSSSSSMGRLGQEEVEAAVAQGLESLAKQELNWDPVQLSAGLPLLGDPLDPQDKLVSKEQYSNLIAAGFRNYLEVLHHHPSIAHYRRAIPLDGSSSFAAVPAAGDDADEAKPPSKGQMHVLLDAKVMGVTQPVSVANGRGMSWNALLEVPTYPPSAGPVGLQLSIFTSSFRGYSPAHKVKAEALEALEAGRTVMYRGRIQPYDPNTGYKPYWPQKPKLSSSFQNLGSDFTVSWDGSTLGVKGGVDDGRGGQLEVEYEKKGNVQPKDWVGKKGGDGIIARVLGEVAQRVGDRDVLPAELREEYGLSGWMEDLRELHNPSGSLERYQRAKRGLAFRELVLMQLAQFLERYRLTTATDGTINAAASVLLPSPDAAAAPRTSRGTAAALAGKTRASRTRSSKAATSSANSNSSSAGSGSSRTGSGLSSSSSGSDSSSDEAPWPPAAPEAAPGQLAAAAGGINVPVAGDLITVCAAQQSDPVSRGAAAYSLQHDGVIEHAKQALPWQLTRGQEEVLSEVLDDMRGPRAMLRLLQGDVGCGKTIVALLACLVTAASGYQALLFAPTELLANQHLKTLEALADSLPLSMRPRVGLLVGGQQGKARKELRAQISSGQKNIVISTQAALWVSEWGKLALVVVDEQHKLGVKQREQLTRGLEAPPHMLLMTATPIPRTLAILQYGGLTLSTISELPPGRTPVETHVVEDAADGRHEVYEAIKQEIASGGRAYIVCPLVDESDTLEGVRTVEDEFARLSSSGIFGDSSNCGKLHGKLKGPEKAEVLEHFKSGETPVLIASTVVEVGVDVPEASIMVVESAHRFGLAQLHQLRGRVGRGSKASRCFLMAPAGDDKAAVRLRVLEESQNGLHIAEADLKIRGFGDLWSGTKQSGKNSQLTAITRRQLEADLNIVHHARYAAAKMLLTISSNHVLKQALLAYGIMVLQDGQKLPVVRDGISGM